MIDSNSLGEVSITKAISGTVYAKLNGVDGVSNSVEIEVTSDQVESLTLAPHNPDVDNYLITDNGYPFNIYSQVSTGASEPCATCSLTVTNSANDQLGSEYYSVDLTNPDYSAVLSILQPGTYYVKAVSLNGNATSEPIEVTVPSNPMASIDVNINATVSTYVGGHITPTVTVHYTDGQTRPAGSVTYSVKGSTPDEKLIDIQGNTLYPLKSGTIELTASYNGLTVDKTVVLQVEQAVTVQRATIHYPQKNAIGELVLNVHHKPYVKVALSNGTTVTYPYEDVAWTIRSSDLAYEQTLQGFKFFYDEKYDGDYAYTEFVGSIYFNGELYQAEDTIGVDSRITNGVWMTGYNMDIPVDEIKVGESFNFYIRVGFHQSNGVYYDFAKDTKAALSNNNARIINESGYRLEVGGESAGPVTIYLYSKYGDFLGTKNLTIVE